MYCGPHYPSVDFRMPRTNLKDYSSQNAYRKKIRAIVLAKLGNKCRRCHFKDPRTLQIDHVLGGSAKLYRSVHHGQLLLGLAKGTIPLADFQLLCANCNWVKRYENNEASRGPRNP